MEIAQFEFPNSSSTDPRDHAENIQAVLQGLVEHLRNDVDKISDPKAQALFETAAEVLAGLGKAFEDFRSRADAWQ